MIIRNMGELNRLADRVLDCAFEIHREIGPGVRESVYERMMAHGLSEGGLYVERQKPISFEHKGFWFENAFYADLVIEKSLIVELKSVQTISMADIKQTLTYLRLHGSRLGL
ncbi:MAG: GxxExxY protein, partial [Longimicrobiales bacterium]